MPFFNGFTALALASLGTSVSTVLSAPSGDWKGHGGWRSHKDPFSNASWPIPRKVYGENDTANVDSATEGWGGIHLHDPSIVLGPDGHYYSFSTHGLTVISRASKKGSIDGYWEIIGSVLDAGSSVIDNSGSTDPWAPDVHKVGDTYYDYYSVSQFGSQISAIGLATSKTLMPGSWTDHGEVFSSDPNATYPLNVTNAIDANLFIDPKTKTPYINYGSFWSNIYQFELADDLKDVKQDTALQLSLDPVAPQPEEGAYMNYHDGWYYLWYSHGTCCGYNASALPAPGEEYSIRVGRSRSPRGPFVDREGVKLTEGGGYIVYGSHDFVYGPGGQGVLSDYHGRDVLYYHYVNTIVDPTYADNLKLLGWNYIDYVQGWPVLSYH
ncbi:endo-1,5-alpha-L-arabinosidase [Hortaea werneckii]|nr:endo-1,5-alpha-L-arabinosidase [Hortaea werneckii]KAI7321406.1 endo-1,5-alpha-L-arabinosidase [Hortaea werneckii]